MTTTTQIGTLTTSMTDDDEVFAAACRAGVAVAARELGLIACPDWDTKWKLSADEVQRVERRIRLQAKEYRQQRQGRLLDGEAAS